MKKRWIGLWSVLYLAVSVLIGAAGGVGTYTFHYAQGASYFSDDAQACANCHLMQPHYDAWMKSSHRHVAVCNDCHAPHETLTGKLHCKAVNGFNHSWAFTTGAFQEPLRITEFNRGITEQACRHCHSEIVHGIDSPTLHHAENQEMSCIRCHADVGHSL